MPRKPIVHPADLRCPVCDVRAVALTGREVYPHRPDLWAKKFWGCPDLHAYVGCYSDGSPLGTLATPWVRGARREAHEAFDGWWRDSEVSRKQAYARLANYLGIVVERCHIGLFDAKTCRKVLEFVESVTR